MEKSNKMEKRKRSINNLSVKNEDNEDQSFVTKERNSQYSLSEKVEALEYYRLGMKQIEISRKFGIPESTLRGWIRNKKAIDSYNAEMKNEEELSSESPNDTQLPTTSNAVKRDFNSIETSKEANTEYLKKKARLEKWLNERGAGGQKEIGISKLFQDREINGSLVIGRDKNHREMVQYADLLKKSLERNIENNTLREENLGAARATVGALNDLLESLMEYSPNERSDDDVNKDD